VLNLQEVWTAALLRILRPHLPSYPHVAVRRHAGQPAGGLVIFSRRPLGEVRYSSYRGARVGGAGLRFRARQWLNTRLQGILVAQVPWAGAVVGNTHLTANRDGDWSVGNRHYPMQRTQLALMHSAVPATADLTVLCGDFNTAASGPLHAAVVGDYRDPFAATDPPTFQASLLESTRRPHRIDYLLVRGEAARYPVRTAATFFADPLPGFGLVSDHVGLVAEIGLPG
jgi:endonuclease/exonuclease/phosphatase family metal-dependent hydrolase